MSEDEKEWRGVSVRLGDSHNSARVIVDEIGAAPGGKREIRLVIWPEHGVGDGAAALLTLEKANELTCGLARLCGGQGTE